ncbi:hypothetical protein DSM106972_097580 [Dulcicalothrix desertica PCC 7102]|uniref:Uncharacterized protein n=1 Tax=Dulcicalothrix desertica PCC 7102 TaxID=232991 RepID=A0A3S1I6U9_9CYAN|nr:hypothetical protein [Dulcicalothrix desertica]RUS93010.1 hypothetical protein DSM106972_097580 [Dulcicalothrix desertica PCC 7102]
MFSSNFTKNNPDLGSPDALSQQVAERLRQAQAQELVKIIGKDTLVDVFQVLFFPDVVSEFCSELEDLGVPVDGKLRAKIRGNEPTVVRHAIDALKEALMQGRVDNPTGFIHHAIQGQWRPNSLKNL